MNKFKVTICQLVSRTYFVHVKQLKFDTIRQETYWSTPKGLSKKFAEKEKAERYAAQFK